MGEISESKRRLIIDAIDNILISDICFETKTRQKRRDRKSSQISHLLTPVKFRGWMGEMSKRILRIQSRGKPV